MVRNCLLILTLIAGLSAHSQQLGQVLFSNGENLNAFSFVTDQGIIIRISDEGKLLKWGTEADNRRYNYVPGQLDEYMGRVDYYGTEADSISRGKVKSIGTCMFSYYGAYEQENKIGKLKSIGAVQLDYYNSYDNVAYKGKLKLANSMMFTYYNSFDNEAVRGKLKSVNNTPIVYFSSFDDKTIKGKVKTIGSYSFNWYGAYDRREYQGNIKNGSYSQYINGITYILNTY